MYASWPQGKPDEMERQLLDLWKSEGLFQRTLDHTRGGDPFVF